MASSYLFTLKPGDRVTLSGPYGDFFVKRHRREMCFHRRRCRHGSLAGHIFHQLLTERTERKMTFWYGARSKSEMFYDEEFKELASNLRNFSYHVALSDPQPEDDWDGLIGFIHQVAHDQYLKDHADPTEIEYYLCGPPDDARCRPGNAGQPGGGTGNDRLRRFRRITSDNPRG